MSTALIVVLLVLTTLWAVVSTTMLFWNPTGFPDKGHRLLGVTSDAARSDVAQLFGRCGFKPSVSYMLCSGPDEEEVFSRQTLLCDGMTVVHSVPDSAFKYGVKPNGASIPTRDPRKSAEEAVVFLRKRGHKAEIVVPPCGPENVFVFVNSSAFDGWSLTYRLPVHRLVRALMPGGFTKVIR